ncbi:MAG: OsmC family protein [Tumebacillaceae bacterium]
MSEQEHSFHLEAKWTGGRLGEGELTSGNLQSKISVPGELGGPGVGTNPEEMLVGAASTCYLITLAAVLHNRKLEIADLTLASEVVVSSGPNMKVERIVHRPRIVLAAGSTPEQVDVAHKGAQRAEQACMISKAMHGNVEITVESQVEVAE